MNEYDRTMNLFRAEERQQQLAAIALRKAMGAKSNRVPDQTGEPLDVLNHAAETSITTAHDQLRAAQADAAQLAANDPELVRLNAALDGVEGGATVIDGSCTTVPDDEYATEIKS